MITSNYIEGLKNIHECCLKFIDDNKEKENLLTLKNLFDDINLYDNKHETKLFFHLIVQISNDHHRKSNFFEKIEKILLLFKNNIKKHFSNSEIFNIFKKNKRILLFLINEQIMQIDEYVAKKISIGKYKIKKYPEYFLSEMKPFMKEKWFQESFKKEELIKELPEDFNKLRNEGENESYICQLIRQDSIEEFVTYVNKNNYSLNSKINQSIYETNSFLLKNKPPSLIEYSVFYGSIQIFQYLQLNQVELTPSLWLYAIHGQNAEIIHILEYNHINPNEDKSFLQCLKRTIKTHSNAIFSYIQNNYLSDIESVKDISIQCFKYYNFSLIQDNYIDQSSFHVLCKYDYYSFVKQLIENDKVDVNLMKDSKTPLFCAVENENIEIVQQLLSCQKIDINLGLNLNMTKEKDKDDKCRYTIITDKCEKTPLFQSIENENLEISKLLISNTDIDINLGYEKYFKKNRVGYYEESIQTETKTTLSIAIEKENLEIIRLLLSNANLESNIIYKENDNIEKSALYLAIEKDNAKIVQLLLTHQTLDINLHNKLSKIISVDDIEKEKEKELIDIENDQDWSLLENEKNYYKCYEDGYDSNDQFEENNITALCLAIEKENIEIIQVLLSNENLDINASNIISRDWRGGSDFDIEPYNIMKIEKTPLCLAVEKGNIEIVKLLLSNDKLNINALNKIIKTKTKSDYYRGDQRFLRRYDEDEKSALYVAIENEKIEIVQLLLSNKKIDVNQNANILYSWQFASLDYNSDLTTGSYEEKLKREKIKSPIYLAIEKDNIEIIKLLLLNNEIDLNYLNKSTECKIKRPVIYENEKDEDELIEQQEGISNEYQNIEINETALHRAVINGNDKIVELLLSKEKIDINILYTKIKNNQTYDNPDNIDGSLRLPYQDFDIKIPDESLTTEELEQASIIDLSQPDEIIGEAVIDNSKEEKTALAISIEVNENIAKLLLSNKNINVCIPKIIESETKTIEYGQISNDKDITNVTPLHLAVMCHKINIISILLKNKNIDINEKDNEGNTPIQCTDDEQIIQLFKQLSDK